MSYYDVPMQDYQMPPAGTPGWQFAPVPGWGKNPDRAGPPRVGVGAAYSASIVPENQAVLPRYTPIGACCGGCGPKTLGALADDYKETTYGHMALAAAGSLMLGILFGYAYWGGPEH